MLRHVRQAIASAGGALSCGLALVVPLAGAQTIADYSRAQSAWLESTMSQAAARSAGLAASAPAVSAPAVSAPAAMVPSAPAPRLPMPAPAPAVHVSGVFASSAGAVAEVIVDATAYLLGVGQGVPGTAWRVEAIAIDKVVLGRPGAASSGKVFTLPALH